ncbi:MAG: putative sugar nucleotidyl transferase, partial [Planctomycetota bacterium]
MNGNIVLFEDNRVDRLEPVTTVRPAFGVTCAAWNLHEIACLAHCSISHIVRKRV